MDEEEIVFTFDAKNWLCQRGRTTYPARVTYEEKIGPAQLSFIQCDGKLALGQLIEIGPITIKRILREDVDSPGSVMEIYRRGANAKVRNSL